MRCTVSYRVEFESSYLLESELHSHRYRLEVTVDGPQRLNDHGAVIDFKTLANHVKSVYYDKQFIYGNSQTAEELCVVDLLRRIGVPLHYIDDSLSVENFCIDIATRLQARLDQYDPGVRLIDVKLRETNDSFASWTRS